MGKEDTDLEKRNALSGGSNNLENVEDLPESEISEVVPMSEALRQMFDGFIDIEGLLDDPLEPKEVAEYIIDPARRYERKEFLILQSGTALGALPRGDISLVKAKPKEGKSTFATILCSVVAGGTFGNLTCNGEPKGVLYIDTEQQAADAQRVVLRVYALCGWNIREDHGFHVASLRDMDMANKLPTIIRLIGMYKPALVVIDGIADLISDFNSIDQSQNVVNSLLRLTAKTKCHVMNILHENKDSNDANAKGHLGSFLTQKASEIYAVSHYKDTFKGIVDRSRDLPVETIYWTINDSGTPQPAEKPEYVKPQRAPTNRDKAREIIKENKDKPTGEIVGILATELEISERQAYRFMPTKKDTKTKTKTKDKPAEPETPATEETPTTDN